MTGTEAAGAGFALERVVRTGGGVTGTYGIVDAGRREEAILPMKVAGRRMLKVKLSAQGFNLSQNG